MTKKLNSTGSLWVNDDGYTYSYNTQLTGTYKNFKVFNNTFYSMTTRKHQCNFNRNDFDLILITCDYGTRLTNYEVEKAIKYEIDYIDDYLKELNIKRNTQKKKATIQELSNRKEFLVSVLSK